MYINRNNYLYRKRKIKTLNYRTFSKGPGYPRQVHETLTN